MIRLIELFAGYGSQALALRYAGIPFESWFVCELDKVAVRAYNALHGASVEPSDIRNISADMLNIVDTAKHDYVLTYSFPCQDLSVNGLAKGMKFGSGTKSSLLWEVIRLLDECGCNKPQYLLMENVPSILNKNNLTEFRKLITVLNKMGYGNFYAVLNSKNYGVPQNRERCFMVSVLKSRQCKFAFPKKHESFSVLADVMDNEVEDRYAVNKGNFYHHDGIVINKVQANSRVNDICLYGSLLETAGGVLNFGRDRIFRDNGIAPALLARNELCQCSSTHLVNVYQSATGKIRCLTPREHFRLMGVRDEDYEKLDGISVNQKYKLAGNSIVVNVLAEIFRSLFGHGECLSRKRRLF